VALLLTDTLQLITEIGGAIGDWALDLAFSPSTWFGIILAGVSVVCFVVAGFVANRGSDAAQGSEPGGRKELAKGRGQKADPVLADADPELAEIEALLRKHGIT
jgi:hypothetical protein